MPQIPANRKTRLGGRVGAAPGYSKAISGELRLVSPRSGCLLWRSGEDRALEADHEYFARRAREERTAAGAAATPEARAEQLELADRFDRLAAALEQHRIKDLD